uniref:VWFA domain-containing protein n=1 Tax=Physcomitrium patens TaxID=3218 RepID=A0A2K1J2N3_PHYPA|nr:hypothetical protein PHYPA_021637 [Physcomitrium patens]
MSRLCFIVVGSIQDFHTPQYAPLQGVAVTGVIHDAVAEYTLVQTYKNPVQDAAVEAAYTFPLYEGAAVVKFEAEVDGRKIIGKVREKSAAKKEYQEAVSAGKTASLLDQEKPDVFQTSIGNIPPGKTISIRITLVSEIKQDAGENQVRFVLPTTVAPRYGAIGFFGNPITPPPDSSAKLSINMSCAMSKPITSVQSPSHTIEVHLGTTDTVDPAHISTFNPNQARVTLTVDSLLDCDLVIVINSLGLDQPRALVERHPSHGTHAIALTFQPRFALQPLRTSEMIFLVDRSGSMMGTQIKQAGEALELFLRSIPFENHYFNIVGFGSNHNFLFPTSVEYTEDSLKKAVHYAQTIQANMGGTEIANAFFEVFQRRRRNVPTQIFLLTDGMVWDAEQLTKSIIEAVDDGARNNSPVRVFTLGVGNAVSHHLIESVARAGGGYAQLVLENERMEKKVLNMLKAGLTPSVTNASVQWSDCTADDFVLVDGVDSVDQDEQNDIKPHINLYSESPLVVSPSSSGSNPPPEISLAIQQAPFKIPILCRGARFTIYAILSPTSPLPKELVLSGDSPDGLVELRVKLDSVVEGETMLHSLAARTLVRDLEEGSSHIHALGKPLTARDEQMLKSLGVHVAPAKGQKPPILPLSFSHVAQITKQKIVDIGVTYSLSTQHTSWVAIDEEGTLSSHEVPTVADQSPQLQPSQTLGLVGRGKMRCAPPKSLFGRFASYQSLAASPSVFGNAQPALGSAPPGFGLSQSTFGSAQAFQSSLFGAQNATPEAGGPSLFGGASNQSPVSAFGSAQPAFGSSPAGFGLSQSTFGSAQPFQTSVFGAQSATPEAGGPSLFGGASNQSPVSAFGSAQPAFGSSPPAFGSAQPAFGSAQPFSGFQQMQQQQSSRNLDDGEASDLADDPHARLRALLQHQSFDGLFPLAPSIAALFNTVVDKLKEMLGEIRQHCTGSVQLTEKQWESIWATCLAVEFMKSKLTELEDEWELVVDKAEQRVKSLLQNSEDHALFQASAKTL